MYPQLTNENGIDEKVSTNGLGVLINIVSRYVLSKGLLNQIHAHFAWGSQILLVFVADEVYASLGVVRAVRHHPLTSLQRSILYNAVTRHWIAVQSIGTAEDGEVRQANLVWVSVDDSRHSEVARVD